ncbi:protein translocase subunit SecF [Pinisolibacter aquiterrae]|uniref:protein translocase subunit SecF n=1 Tax=Pinisolibacter aquiterrae TaxID=2815579 RepID=UPI001C3C5FE5|nr:protein translocase subunit SecF [Pinisolibacter aquiterrae]MCC8235980.1 protein translocase subunit SecF [Pinisolibacter aquiterrae]
MRLIKLIPEDTKIPFMGARLITFPISMVLVTLSILAVAVFGLNYGIDFAGGTVIEVRAHQTPADLHKIRTDLSALNIGEVQVQGFGQAEDVLIRLAQQEGDELAQQAGVAKVKATLGNGYDYRRVEVVGPRVSADLRRDGAIAVVVSLFVILIYLWFRFEWQFAVGAVLTTIHDVVLTLGLLAVLQISFDLTAIAAILTLVGYSLNDTVVIYDRIRENLRKYKKMDLASLIDLSINQTLTRTIRTSTTTFLAMAAMYVFGGEALRGFNFTMLAGIVIGTYSSIVVSAPLLIFLNLRTGGGKGAEKTEGAATATA